MNIKKEEYWEKSPTSFVRNTFSLLIAACVSSCAQETWITLPDHANPYLSSRTSSGPNENYQKPVIPDRYNLEKLGQFIGAKKEGRYDEFVDDYGNVFTREELESRDE